MPPIFCTLDEEARLLIDVGLTECYNPFGRLKLGLSKVFFAEARAAKAWQACSSSCKLKLHGGQKQASRL